MLLAQGLDDDFVLTNITIHWLCRTAGSSIRFYYEDAKAENPTEPTTIPIGLAGFANDFQSIRRFAERDHKSITQWHTFDVGGHYAAHQVPEVLARRRTRVLPQAQLTVVDRSRGAEE